MGVAAPSVKPNKRIDYLRVHDADVMIRILQHGVGSFLGYEHKAKVVSVSFDNDDMLLGLIFEKAS